MTKNTPLKSAKGGHIIAGDIVTPTLSLLHWKKNRRRKKNLLNLSLFALNSMPTSVYGAAKQWLTSSSQVDNKAAVENSAASQILGSCDRVHHFQTHADLGTEPRTGRAVEPVEQRQKETLCTCIITFFWVGLCFSTLPWPWNPSYCCSNK